MGKTSLTDKLGLRAKYKVRRRREFLIGAFGVSTFGVISTQAPSPKLRNHVSPRSHGAVGDGIANDTDGVNEALAHAFQNGLPVDGGGAVYAVSGNIQVRDAVGPWIKSLRLRQLDPANGRVTLFLNNCENVRLDHLEIDVGTGKTLGDMNSSGGFWIDGGSHHRIQNVEVFGHGKNSLIAIWNTAESQYDGLRVRDAEFDAVATDDDVMQGIWLNRNTDCILSNPQVANLTGNASYLGVAFANLRTRGIAMTGNVRVSVTNPRVWNVDQGIDLTGSDGNRQCTISGGRTFQCTTVGLKLANSAFDCKVIGHVAERIGMYAFLASGPSELSLPYKTQNCELINCTALDVGYNKFPFKNPSAFYVLAGDFDRDFPKGIRFVGCHAKDRQVAKTMKYGFYTDVIYDMATKKPNELLDCKSEGHMMAAQFGMWR